MDSFRAATRRPLAAGQTRYPDNTLKPQQQFYGISHSADERQRAFKEANPPRAKQNRSGRKVPVFVPRVRLPGEATSNSFDIRADDYVPAKHNPPQPTRPNALDFMDKPSKGLRT